MQEIFNYHKIINEVRQDFQKYLFEKINREFRLNEIGGTMCCGKTILILKKTKLLKSGQPSMSLYIMPVDRMMVNYSITDPAECLKKNIVKQVYRGLPKT